MNQINGNQNMLKPMTEMHTKVTSRDVVHIMEIS